MTVFVAERAFVSASARRESAEERVLWFAEPGLHRVSVERYSSDEEASGLRNTILTGNYRV